MRYHISSVKLDIIKKGKDIKCCQWYREMESLCSDVYKTSLGTHYREEYGDSLEK
jgi:hypothetical protein